MSTLVTLLTLSMSTCFRSIMATSRAAGARKERDRSYRHVFKGSVLINTLLDYDTSRFSNRQAAVKFAQKLLDLGTSVASHFCCCCRCPTTGGLL